MELDKHHQSTLDMYYREGHVKAWNYWKLLGYDYGIFLGEVPSDEFITGSDLCSSIGLTGGELRCDDVAWLKFILDGNIICVSKQHIKNYISWKNIYQAGAVYGTDDIGMYPSGGDRIQDARVNIDGYEFRVTLLEGANEDRVDSTDCLNKKSDEWYNNSEWNRLMYPIHHGVFLKSYNNVQTIFKMKTSKIPFGRWAKYSDDNIESSVGDNVSLFSWCVESLVSDACKSEERVLRGGHKISNATYDGLSLNLSMMGYRPCLRLIEK